MVMVNFILIMGKNILDFIKMIKKMVLVCLFGMLKFLRLLLVFGPKVINVDLALKLKEKILGMEFGIKIKKFG